MSDSNWGVRAAVIGALTALSMTALGVGAFFGALHTPNYGYETTESANRRSQSEQTDPTQIDRNRAGLPYFAERIASGPDPQSPQEREQRDLAAQESMSVWAFWLLIVSSVGTVATMIGTGFLLWQIILTRKAVEDTGEATEAMREQNCISRENSVLQFRPYMGTLGAAVFFPFTENPRVVIDVKNFGQTPARIFKQVFSVVHFARQKDGTFKRIFYEIPTRDNALCDPGHTQSRTAIIDGSINLLNGDQVFAELTFTYRSFDGAIYWRRISYYLSRLSLPVDRQKYAMDVHETDQEEGEGEPPPTNLPAGI